MKFSIINAVACTLLAATGAIASPVVQRDNISSSIQTFQTSTPEQQAQMLKSLDLNKITPDVCRELAQVPVIAQKLITPAVVKSFVKKFQEQHQ